MELCVVKIFTSPALEARRPLNAETSLAEAKNSRGGAVLINKTCSCGKLHRLIPHGAIFFNKGCAMDGYWWDCLCRSTLFVPLKSLEAA